MNEKNDRLSELEDILAEAEGQSTDEILTDLKKAGIDTERFLARANSTMQTQYRSHLRKLAESEQAESASTDFVLPGIETMDREMMLASFDRIRSGEMGEDHKEAALARCRNSDATALTDDELRSWLSDIGEIYGKPDSEE